MQTHSQPVSPLNQPNNIALQQQVPWWNDLDALTRQELELPSLEEKDLHDIDIAVIGGGVAGLSAALSARKHGANVIVLEREAILGYGATGQNAGILTPGINMSMSELPSESPAISFFPETTAQFFTLIAEAARPETLLSAQITGALCLAKSGRTAQKLEREVRIRNAANLHAELWSPSRIAEATEGRLNLQSVIHAMWLPHEGRINPLTLLAHLAKQLRCMGGLLAGQTHLVDYQEAKKSSTQKRWQLTLANGTRLSTRGLIVTTGPTIQPNARIYALAFPANLPTTFPLFWDASSYTYTDYRPGNGRLSVSGGRYGKVGRSRKDAAYHKRLAEATRHWLPELTGVEPDYRWAVDLSVTADMIPGLRILSSTAPGVAIEGLGAHGVLPGIVLASRAAEFVIKQMSG